LTAFILKTVLITQWNVPLAPTKKITNQTSPIFCI